MKKMKIIFVVFFMPLTMFSQLKDDDTPHNILSYHYFTDNDSFENTKANSCCIFYDDELQIVTVNKGELTFFRTDKPSEVKTLNKEQFVILEYVDTLNQLVHIWVSHKLLLIQYKSGNKLIFTR